MIFMSSSPMIGSPGWHMSMIFHHNFFVIDVNVELDLTQSFVKMFVREMFWFFDEIDAQEGEARSS